jgi:hypothetical protein
MESDFGTNSIFNLASFTNAGYCLNGFFGVHSG